MSSLTTQLLDGASEQVDTGEAVPSEQQVVELLHGELCRHAEGGHEEDEATDVPGAGVGDQALIPHDPAAPRQRRHTRVLCLRLWLGAPGAHVQLQQEHAGGGVRGTDEVPPDGVEHEPGGVRGAEEQGGALAAQPRAVPQVGGPDAAQLPRAHPLADGRHRRRRREGRAVQLAGVRSSTGWRLQVEGGARLGVGRRIFAWRRGGGRSAAGDSPVAAAVGGARGELELGLEMRGKEFGIWGRKSFLAKSRIFPGPTTVSLIGPWPICGRS